MKAIVLDQIGRVAVRERPEPRIEQPGDAVVRVTLAGICGSDLHIVHGRDRGVRPGTIMGHELVGIVEAVGPEVEGIVPGQRVVAPFTVSCGRCFYCDRGLSARCLQSAGFGFVTEQGDGLEGAQAERVRVPMATSTLKPLPERRADGAPLTDDEALFLGDILSTAWSAVEAAGPSPGAVVAVIGCGPVGLLAVQAAFIHHPVAVVAIDGVDHRRERARRFGAETATPERAAGVISDLTGGRGADAVVEAVGAAPALELALRVARPGAIVSVAGYHTDQTFPFPIQAAYAKNLTLKVGRCSARRVMETLLPLVLQGRFRLTEIVSHVLPLEDAPRGYELFATRSDGAIKVLLRP